MGEGRNQEMTQPQVPLLYKTSLTVRKNPIPKTKQQSQVISRMLGQENIVPPSLLQEGLFACSRGCKTLLFPPIPASTPYTAWEFLRLKFPLPGDSHL